MRDTFRKVNTLVEKLRSCIVEKNIEIGSILSCPCGYKTDNTLPAKEDMTPFAPNDTWGAERDSHCWFRLEVDVPEDCRGKEIELSVRTELDGWDAVNPQFIAYVNGKMTQGMDTNHTTVPLTGADHYVIYLYGYSGPQTHHLRFFADISVIRTDVRQLYYDLEVPLRLFDYLEDDSYEYAQILTYLDRAVTRLNMLVLPSDEFFATVKDAETYIRKEFYGKFCRKNDTAAICIGHTHIDIAWLWTIAQTREKAQRSFSTVINLMKRYPEYKFMSSQAYLYKAVKEETPELYEEIKAMIKAGRWEVEGAMWVEADCNLSSGESLVRQVMYGKQFFKDEFDVDSHVLWLPDVFGYSAALPQILRKSGVDWFVTSKIGWNDTNKMPYDIFSWRGIDGTEINSYFLTAQPKIRGQKPARETTYIPNTLPATLAGAYERLQQKNLTNEAIVTFGFGDGGGGPTADQLEILRRAEYGIPGTNHSEIRFAGDFLAKLEKKIQNNPYLPRWQGELYLEFHRGTLTSIGRNKRNNRKSEFAFLDTEMQSVMANKLLGKAYPKAELHEGWEIILTDQFHDIIPGSSIPQVYEDTDRDYKKLFAFADGVRSDIRRQLLAHIAAEGKYVVFNGNSFPVSSCVIINGEAVYVENVPAKGYKVVDAPVCESRVTVSEDLHSIETPFFRVKLDKNFNISRLYDKKCRREVLKKGALGNRMVALQDYPDCYDAWEFQQGSNDKDYPIDDVQSATLVNCGAKTGIRIVRRHMDSLISQTIWFYSDIKKIDFDTNVDWHQIHQVLKVSFPVDVNSDRATYEIQFGTIERPTHTNTSWDKAKYEVCGHKYADLSEGDYGVSLVNDCKYGYDIHDSDMRLTLIKSGMNPSNNPEDKNDQGEHIFTYSICPHAGDLNHCDTVKLAYDLNLPLVAEQGIAGDGTLPNEYSLVRCDKDHVIVETVKEAEKDDSVIVRAYETKNTRTKATFTFGFDVSEVALCDLSENELQKLPVRGRTVTVPVNPFEIVTLKVK
ncbi:MAG: alpha-mannosidase [Clostridia bacterium]|nr:alpha-mannosidase [Clostridia bacterium]